MRKKKGPLKKLIRTIQAFLFGHLGALLLAGIYGSMRWQRNDLVKLQNKHPFIAAFWHGRQLMLAPLFGASLQKGSTAVLISPHTDGRIIARAIKWFGLESVAGSSSQGSVVAFRDLVSLCEAGKSIAITPDGPRGPCQQLKTGVLRLAQITKLPILPMTFAATSVWRFSSWDTMILPKPFSKGICLVDEEYFVTEDKDEAFHRSELEKRLNELSEKAEALLEA